MWGNVILFHCHNIFMLLCIHIIMRQALFHLVSVFAGDSHHYASTWKSISFLLLAFVVCTDQLSVRWSISSSSPVLWAGTPSSSVVHTPPHRLLPHLRVCLPCLTNLRVSPGNLWRWYAQSCTAKSSSGLYCFHSDTHQNSIPEWKLLASAKRHFNHNHLR